MFKKMNASEIIISGTNAQFRPTNDIKNRLDAIPREFHDWISQLKDLVTQSFLKKENVESDMRCRVVTLYGEKIIAREILTTKIPLYICRLNPPKPEPFSTLKYIQRQAKNELSNYATSMNTGGVVIVSSIPSRGNTYTAASMYSTVIETHGGTGIYLSRSHPFDLDGPTENTRGATTCFDLPNTPEQVNDTLIRCLATSPRFGFIDSITTPEDAKLALELASSGLLIYLSIDSGSITSAIELLVAKASSGYADLITARNITANVLRAAMHIQDEKETETKYLFLGDPETTPSNIAVSDKIRNNHIPTLKSNIDTQTALINRDKPFIARN